MKANTATCQTCTSPATANAAKVAVTKKLPQNVTRARLLRSKRSASRPPIGDTSRKGSIEAKVITPTSPDESDSLSTSHELATMNVHNDAPENMLAAQRRR